MNLLLMSLIRLKKLRLPLHRGAGPEGWLPYWAKRIEITIDHNDVDTTLTWFPVLLYLSDSSGITGTDVSCIFDEVGANSLKIAVTSDDGETQLYVEIEKWDDGSETAWLWISKDGWEISDSEDTIIYIYYDNEQDDNTTYVGTIENRTEVWNSEYEAVFHMRDKTTATIADSTSNGNDATKKDVNEPAIVVGCLDGAQDFAGDDDFAELDSITGLSPTEGTITMWLLRDDWNSSSWTDPFYYEKHGDTSERIGFSVGAETPRLQWEYFGNDVSKYDNIACGGWSGWQFIGMKWSHTADEAYGWRNEARFGVTRTELPTPLTLDACHIGCFSSGEGHREYWKGLIDEVRISSVFRTDDWLEVEYESQRDHLVTFGSEELKP